MVHSQLMYNLAPELKEKEDGAKNNIRGDNYWEFFKTEERYHGIDSRNPTKPNWENLKKTTCQLMTVLLKIKLTEKSWYKTEQYIHIIFKEQELEW